MFTIAYGNAFDGIQLIGLFDDANTAGDWAERNLDSDWVVIDIAPMGDF